MAGEEVGSLGYVLIINKHPCARNAARLLEDLTGKKCNDPWLVDHGNLAKILYSRIAGSSESGEQLDAVQATAKELFERTETAYRSCVAFCIADAQEKLQRYERRVVPCMGRSTFSGAPTLLALENMLRDAKHKANFDSHIGPDVLLAQWEPHFKRYTDVIQCLRQVTSHIEKWLKEWERYVQDVKRLRWQRLGVAIAVALAILGWVPSVRDSVAAFLSTWLGESSASGHPQADPTVR